MAIWAVNKKLDSGERVKLATATKVDVTVKHQMCVMEIPIIVTDVVYR